MSNEHSEYLKKLRRKARLTTALRLALFALTILLWEAAGRLGLSDPFIISSPARVAKTVASLYARHELFPHVLTTFAETVMGFVSGTAIGVAFAVLLWFFPFLDRVLDPYLVVLNALPKIALGPILIVWVGAGPSAIIVMALLVSTVVTVMSVLSGFKESGAELDRLMRSLGATRAQTFLKAVLPASVPTIMSALKISVGMSWVGVIVGEYLVSKRGLGYLIVYGGQVFKLDLVMASIAILCLLAALMYYAVAAFEKRVSRRFGRAE
ncbi:MAG: ABC transporter permease [Clostridiales bacterium]|nr:ABC transporter permease [Clostridiales bacterium]